MTYITWKERQTHGSLFEKALNLQSVKNIVEEKMGYDINKIGNK